jgi:hypothetical protein
LHSRSAAHAAVVMRETSRQCPADLPMPRLVQRGVRERMTSVAGRPRAHVIV